MTRPGEPQCKRLRVPPQYALSKEARREGAIVKTGFTPAWFDGSDVVEKSSSWVDRRMTVPWVGEAGHERKASRSRRGRNIRSSFPLILILQQETLQHPFGSLFQSFGLAGALLPPQQ